jgi:hypothetical protein
MLCKADTAPTAPFILHRTGNDKYAIKKFGINGRLQKLFLIVIHCFSLLKAMINALHICKLHNGVYKKPQFLFFFNCQRRKEDHCTLVNCGGVEFLKLR